MLNQTAPLPDPSALAPKARASRPDTLDRIMLALTLCVWAGHFLLLSVLIYFTSERPSDSATLVSRAITSGVAIGLCLGMYALLRRRDVGRPWHLLLVAVGLSVPLSVLLMLTSNVSALLFTPFYDFHPDHWMDPYLMTWGTLSYLWILLTWSALFVGVAVILEVRRREAQLAAARNTAQQAQLLALRLQINPHFLFNTLNTLAGFIVLDRRGESERIVLNLSRFLRHTLARTPSQLVPLSEEIDMLRMYLEIETARFRDRLAVRYDIPAECGRALVPGLILLPLAENSIKYALNRVEDGIEIGVGARREGEALLLWLQDDGPPQADADDEGLGIGLSNTRQQLAALYGEAAALEAGPQARGWRNLIRVPWREAAP